MGYNQENYRRIRREYEGKYLRAREDADRRRAEVERALPALKQVNAQLSATGLELMRVSMAYADDAAAREASVAALRQKNEELQALKGKILTDAGYGADYTALRYECERCSDTGYLDDGKMCACMREKLILAGYESSGLGMLLREQRFDNYSLDYFKTDERTWRSMNHAYYTLKEYAEQFRMGSGEPSSGSLLLMGGTGLGKTHLSTAVAKTVLDAGYDVLYTTAVMLVGDFEMARFGNSGAAGDMGITADTSRYFDCDLLIIDDLGTEVANQFTTSCLYNIINTRLAMRRPTIISTNLLQDELRRRYWDRITSRLFGEYKILLFLGTDVRAQKVKAGK